jgi:hypothetical protein
MVEIIPKPEVKTSLWLNILFYFSCGLLLLCLLSIFLLNLIQKKTILLIRDLETVLSQNRIEAEPLEKEVLPQQKRIDDFAKILINRRRPTNFFLFLEKFTHPRIQFTEVNLDLAESKVGLSGRSESFLVLGQQVSIFERQKEVKKVNLSKLAIAKEGGAVFSLSLNLDPELFK